MRLLIAGWHGQVARALAERGPARPEISSFVVGQAALDLCRPASIRVAMIEARPDVVINTAAYTGVDKAEGDENAVFQLNCQGAGALAAVAARKNIPLIHLSSDYVFGGAKADPYTEEDIPRPRSVYGRSKLCGEQAVIDANPMHIVLRTAWVYSPFGRNFVKNILNIATERAEIDVVDDQVGCPTYALHLADLILDIAIRIASGRDTISWGVYHATSSGGASWCTFAREVFEISKALGGPVADVRPIGTQDFPTRAPRLKNARLDSSKLMRNFGVGIPDWREGVGDCVRRLLANEGERPGAEGV